MKLFSCVCDQILFFESVSCTRCGRALAFLPDRAVVTAVVADDTHGATGGGPALWRVAADGGDGPRYRLCRNYREHAVCNWAVPAGDSEEYCRACRLNQVIPNLADGDARQAWNRLEIAKRRLVYTLLDLGLPVDSKAADPERGLAFAFLKEETAPGAARVLTGHNQGLVTINIAEANDPWRERMRVQMGETYRTVLGHFRHETGHYYWRRLIDGSTFVSAFRERFGDERADYAGAQERHYRDGPPADWQQRFVSAYASTHPWEDWAETWAHYLHMVDTSETARAHGLALEARPVPEGPSQPAIALRRLDRRSFDDLASGWLPLTLALNSLNRSMGLPDPYPFVLSDAALAKLRFMHEVIEASNGTLTPRT
jgi:hypothetical protein